MLIPNHHAFKNLDPSRTPAIKSGSLFPPEDWATEELLGMAPKSLYLSCIRSGQNGCDPGEAVISMWIKAKQSGDSCSTGSCSDWQEISVGGISRGEAAPIGSDPDWCCKPVGAWYIQICGSNPQPFLWLKIREGCTEGDWYLVSPTSHPIYFSDEDPNMDDANCALPVGSVMYQYCPPRPQEDCPTLEPEPTMKSVNLIRWEKVTNKCKGHDWINTSATPTLRLAEGVEFDCTNEAIECLPVGSFVYRAETCEIWVRLNCVGSEDCSDWCFIDNHPPMTVTEGEEFEFNKEEQTLVLPRNPMVFCGAEAPADPIGGDVWINNSGDCAQADSCCSATFIWAPCLGEAGEWKKIWGSETGATAQHSVASLIPYKPENEITSFPAEVDVYSDLTPLPGAFGEDYTFTLKCPAMVHIDTNITFSVLPKEDIDPGTGLPEPLDAENGRTALTACLLVDGEVYSCNDSTAHDFTESHSFNTPWSIRLGCGDHTLSVQTTATHTGKVIGENPDGSDIIEANRQQQWWIESVFFTAHWDERC